jgi:hypothetical protein
MLPIATMNKDTTLEMQVERNPNSDEPRKRPRGVDNVSKRLRDDNQYLTNVLAHHNAVLATKISPAQVINDSPTIDFSIYSNSNPTESDESETNTAGDRSFPTVQDAKRLIQDYKARLNPDHEERWFEKFKANERAQPCVSPTTAVQTVPLDPAPQQLGFLILNTQDTAPISPTPQLRFGIVSMQDTASLGPYAMLATPSCATPYAGLPGTSTTTPSTTLHAGQQLTAASSVRSPAIHLPTHLSTPPAMLHTGHQLANNAFTMPQASHHLTTATTASVTLHADQQPAASTVYWQKNGGLDIILWDPNRKVFQPLEQISEDKKCVFWKTFDDTIVGSRRSRWTTLARNIKTYVSVDDKCLTCTFIHKGNKSGQMEWTGSDTLTACSKCKKKSRPCVRVVEHGDTQTRKIKLAWFPLGESERTSWSMEDIHFWVLP